jgi:hypothetical protein
VIGTKFHSQTSLLELDKEGSIWFHPQAVLDQRECRLRQKTIKEVFSLVEGYNSKRFHMGVDYHSETISSFPSLIIRLFFKGDGMLGT